MSDYFTSKYRIMDSTSGKHLDACAKEVNNVWNFCNKKDRDNIEEYRKLKEEFPDEKIPCKVYSEFTMNKLLVGYSNGKKTIHSDSVQEVSRLFATAKTAKLKYLFANRKSNKFISPTVSWRSEKRSLPFIPFKGRSIKITELEILPNSKKKKTKISIIKFLKRNYRFWNSRPLPEDAKIKTGSFNKNSDGKWFFTVIFTSESLELKKLKHNSPNSIIGIDLGVKSLMTLSEEDEDGNFSISPAGCTKKYEEKLAKAQRAKKKRQVVRIHNKIKNVRKDYLHKVTTKLCKQFGHIAVGDVSSQDIIDKNLGSNMNKGVYDASWYFLKILFKYKAKKLGCIYEEIPESYTTQECNKCLSRCGPKGPSGLKIRAWTCFSCHAAHDRDINSAINIRNRYILLHLRCETNVVASDMKLL